MKITDIKIRKLIPDGKLRGIVSITLDDVLAVHDIKIIQSDEYTDSLGQQHSGRLFVAMPSRRDDDRSGGQLYRDIVHPINSETRRSLEDKILAAYRQEVSRLNSAESGS